MKWKFRTILMICNNGELNSSLLSPNFVVFCTEFKTAKWHYGLLTLVGGIVGGFWRSRLGRDVSTVFSLSRWFPYKCWFFDFLLGILYLKTNGGSHLFLLFLRIQNKNPWFFDLFFFNVSFEKVKLVLLVSSMLIFWWVKLTLKIDCQVTKDKRCFIANKEICGWGGFRFERGQSDIQAIPEPLTIPLLYCWNSTSIPNWGHKNLFAPLRKTW